MGFSGTGFSTNRNAFDLAILKAGDAAEMEARFNAAIVASASPNIIGDMVLCGVGEGPEWVCLAYFNKIAGQTRATTRAACAVAASPEEAYLRLKERLAATGAGEMSKVEIAGGGNGKAFMAMAIFELN